MAKAHLDYDPTFSKQLNGSSTQSVDCGVMTVRHAIDWQTLGERAPTRKVIRDNMDKEGKVGTTYLDWEHAVERQGLDGTSYSTLNAVRKYDRDWSEVMDRLKADKPVMIGVDYGVLRSKAPAKTGSESFNGYHGLFLRESDKGGDQNKQRVRVFDSLNDGRYQGCPIGPVRIEAYKVKEAAQAYNVALGKSASKVSYVIAWAGESDEPLPPPPPPVDPCEADRRVLLGGLMEFYNDLLEWLHTHGMDPAMADLANQKRVLLRAGREDQPWEPEDGMRPDLDPGA